MRKSLVRETAASKSKNVSLQLTALLSVSLTLCMPARLPVCLSARLSICMSVRLYKPLDLVTIKANAHKFLGYARFNFIVS